MVDFPRNCEMEMVATCSTNDGNGSYHGLAPSFFEEMTRCRCQKHCRRRPDNPNGPSKFYKYCVFLPLLRLFTSARSLLLFHGSGIATHPHRRISKRLHVADVKKLDLRWPGNHNDRSKFCNLGLFTRSQLTLRRRLCGFWRSLKRHVTDVKNIAGMTRIDRNSSNTKIYAYEIKQNVSKTSFSCHECHRDWRHCALFFLLSLEMAFVFTFEK